MHSLPIRCHVSDKMGAFHKFAAEEADKTKTAICTRRIIVIVDAPPGVLVYAMRKYTVGKRVSSLVFPTLHRDNS